MNNRAKIALAVTVVVLMTAVIILVNVTKNKETVPGQDITETTATPEVTVPASSPTAQPTLQPTQTEEAPTAILTEEPTPTELTEEQKLMTRLLQDPYNLEGESPLESVTVIRHSEQTANLDRNNMFMIDVSAELDELGVPYVPLSVAYDAEGEYIRNGRRTWSGYISDRKSSNGGSAVIYDFSEGTVHSYSYISNYGKYEDDGVFKISSGVTEDTYEPWPKYNFYDMFSEALPPEIKETETEYIVEGYTTSNGYTHNSETDIFTVSTNPDNGFQYLIKLTIHYDRETLRVKCFDAEVTGKIIQELFGISNDPTAEKVESDIGLITSTLHVEFTKYNDTVLTKLDGKVYVDVEKYQDKGEDEDKPAETVHVYTFADGTHYYFTSAEWEKAGDFLNEPAGGGGYDDFLNEIISVQNDYANGYVILKDIPKELRDEWCMEDKAWEDALDSLSRRPINPNPMNYELPQFAGYYNTPLIPYLCELLLDEKGELRGEYIKDAYTGKDYGYLINIAQGCYTDLIGTEFMPVSKLKNIFGFKPEEVSKFVWEYEPTQYSGAIMEADRGNIRLSKDDMTSVLILVRDDIRIRFESKLKAWVMKNKIGTAVKP